MHLVSEAKAFIAREATSGISSNGVARRLADLRFHEFEHHSILEEITRVRLETLKRRLKEDGVGIGKTILACGFRNLGYAQRLFKRRYGLTMSEFRKQSGL